MGIEGQQPFEATPLGAFGKSVDQQEAVAKQKNEQLETDDGFVITIDRKSDNRGIILRSENNNGRTEFLLINGKLYNPSVIRDGVTDTSQSRKTDEQVVNIHGHKLTKLIGQGLIN